MSRKYEQVKKYARIMKYRRQGGKIEEVQMPATLQNHPEELIQEEDQVDMPKQQQFQDPIEDQYQQEEGWISASDSDHEENNESGTMMSEQKQSKQPARAPQEVTQAFLGNSKGLGKGQVLQFDNKAYDMLHRLDVEWPSMSIDFIAKGSPFQTLPGFHQMHKYPYEIYTVQGSSNNSKQNSIYFTKWHKLHKTKFDDDPDAADEQQQDQDPQFVMQELQTGCDVNRIRSLNYSPIVALWNDQGHKGQIRIVDMSSNLQKLKAGIASKRRQSCKQIVLQTQTAGYGLCWNPHKIGQLIAGDNDGVIKVYANNQNYTKWVQTQKYSYHSGSVEDICFSPEQAFVFASCSSDGSLQVVDMRAKNYKKAQLNIKAHPKDVNVCDWNSVATHLLVTGSDDCSVKIWDLRMVSEGVDEQLLRFGWHTEPITSVRFQPNEQSVIVVASQDNRLTVWDMAVQNQQLQEGIPNELMFLHQGQEEIKEVAYHPVYFEMLVSTAIDSINIFKPSYEAPQPSQGEKGDQQDLKKPPIREEDLDKYLQKMSLQ